MGEGTDRGDWLEYCDLKSRVELRFENDIDLPPFPLSPLGRGLG